jgi:hypothetical protein
VAKVIVFSTSGNYSTATVSQGSFSIPVDPGTPLGMVFAGSSDNYLGYLTLGNGINSLPLTDVASGVTSIDLQTLTASGAVVSPGNNPLGTALPLTTAEQAAYAQSNGMFAAVVKNPDVDGNGVIDVLENKNFHPFVAYWVNPMNFNGALTPVVSSGLAIQNFNLTVTSSDASDDASATVTGPAGSGITNYPCTLTTSSSQVSYAIYPNLGSSTTAVPMAGAYTFTTGGGKTLTVNVTDQSSANANIVVAVPTVTLNSDHTLNSLTWTFTTQGSGGTLSPTALVQDLIVEIDRPVGTRVYNSSNLASSITSHTLTDQTIPWDATVRLYMAYNDVFGNHYVVPFNGN